MDDQCSQFDRNLFQLMKTDSSQIILLINNSRFTKHTQNAYTSKNQYLLNINQETMVAILDDFIFIYSQYPVDGLFILFPLQYKMSMRNKKLTALHTIHNSIEHSLQNTYKMRGKSHQHQLQPSFLQKLTEKPIVKRFIVKKIHSKESQSIQRKSRFKSLRMNTQKLTSPMRKNQLSANERSYTVERTWNEKEEPYPFMTKFQKQQSIRYQIFYIGARRISSLKDFTNSNCQAKIAAKDAIAYRYEIIKLLGQGSFGQVFKAYDHKKKQMVAIKIIRNQLKFNKQAKIEIKILETVIINDPRFKSNIIQLKHAFFFRGHACLVFELLHINLYQFSRQLKFNGFSLDLIRKIAIQILQGLLFLKRQNIIHCDLKPENILLKQQHKTGIKIIDVGSGCFENQQLYTYIQSRFYRAPEIILGLKYTTAIDIWSLGCILCELYLGYPIFPGQNEPEQILMFMEVLGVPPVSFIEKGSRSHLFFQGKLARIKPNSKGKLRKPNTKPLQIILQSCKDDEFVSYVKQFFKWQPEERISPEQALSHNWILKGLPEQIRKQHLAMIHKPTYI